MVGSIWNWWGRWVTQPTYTAQLQLSCFFSWYDQLMIWFSADFQLILIRLVGSAGSKRGDSSQRDTQLSSSNSWFSASTIRSLNSLMKLYCFTDWTALGPRSSRICVITYKDKIYKILYSCNNITATLIQISGLFYFGSLSKTNHHMMDDPVNSFSF